MPTHTHLSHQSIGRLRRWFAALLVVAAACGAGASTAQAGQYRVYVCRMPDGTTIPLPPEMYASRPLAGAVAFENCTQGGAVQFNYGSAGAPEFYGFGEGVSWSYGVSSSSLSIEGVSMRRVAVTTADPHDYGATPYVYARYGGFATSRKDLEGCAVYSGCQVGRWDAGYSAENDVAYRLPAGTSLVEFGVFCNGERFGSCYNMGVERVQEVIWKLEFEIHDDVAPSVQRATGTALDASVKRGTVNATYAATDDGSGLYQSVVSVDGQVFSRSVVDDNAGRCADAGARANDDLEFLTAKPCKSAATAKVSIDTTRIPDGRHVLDIGVRDAAGNVTNVYSGNLEVDNVPPPRNTARPLITAGVALNSLRPGDALGVQSGVWDGKGLSFERRWQRSSVDGASWADIAGATGEKYTVVTADVARQLRVVVTASNSDGSATATSDPTEIVKTGATVVVAGVKPESGAAEGNGDGGNPSTGQLVVDREQRTVEVKHGAKIVITGRLVDADGQPIAGAQVDVFEQIATTAAPWTKVGSVKTDSQGGYLFRPRTTASRRLRFAYSDRRDASDYRATREVFVSVTAGMTISARHRVLQRRGVIRLKGHVVVDSLPASGTWIEVQVLDAGVWRTVAARRTSRTGLWSFRHRLRQSAGITFRFRARLKPAGDVPSAEARSAPIKVRVR